jgi:hypothetical protein
VLILDAATRLLEFKLAGAITTNPLSFVASYVEVSQADFALTAVSANTGQSNNTTVVTIIPAPAAGRSRQLKYLSIQQSDSVPATVIIQVDDGGTKRRICSWTLAIYDTLIYEDGQGWYVLDAQGSLQ